MLPNYGDAVTLENEEILDEGGSSYQSTTRINAITDRTCGCENNQWNGAEMYYYYHKHMLCANGTAAVGDACTSDGAYLCASCDTDHTLTGRFGGLQCIANATCDFRPDCSAGYTNLGSDITCGGLESVMQQNVVT